MKLGIPTLVNYDGLDALLRSAEAGSLRPSGYIIIDNGNAYPRSRLNEVLGARAEFAELIAPGRNLGVAASWNRMLDMAADDPIVISNDDIVFGPATFAEMALAACSNPFVEGEGWALFAQSPECTERVGYYDENYWPAYYEDVDYDLRLTRAGITPQKALSTPVHHGGWATTRALGDPAWLTEGRARNHAYFLRKWGAESANPRWNGHEGMVHYPLPFNGPLPPGWGERKRMSTPPPMRWDVLNYIAKRIGARRYLEIGVSDGTCMRHVEVEEKWGIDPWPVMSGVQAATVFVPHSSDEFFENVSVNAGKFDLVFIDGDHAAEQVEREVGFALGLLQPHGVIVLHDCNPHTEAMQEVPFRAGEWTGDVWKAVARIRFDGSHTLRVVNSDYGIGVLIPWLSSAELHAEVDWAALSWSALVAHRAELLGLVDPSHWEAWFDTTREVSDTLGP